MLGRLHYIASYRGQDDPVRVLELVSIALQAGVPCVQLRANECPDRQRCRSGDIVWLAPGDVPPVRPVHRGPVARLGARLPRTVKRDEQVQGKVRPQVQREAVQAAEWGKRQVRRDVAHRAERSGGR